MIPARRMLPDAATARNQIRASRRKALAILCVEEHPFLHDVTLRQRSVHMREEPSADVVTVRAVSQSYGDFGRQLSVRIVHPRAVDAIDLV